MLKWMRKSKNSYFYHIFVYSRDALATMTQYFTWMKRQFDTYKLCRRMYPSIFNSFPVIWTTSAKNHRFHVPQSTFLFPLRTPLGQSCWILYGWKENSMLINCVAACTHLSSTVSQLFEPQVQKIAVFMYGSRHFCFPWRLPCGSHVKCYMDGKRIGTDGHRVTALMYTHRARRVSDSYVYWWENLAAINVREKFRVARSNRMLQRAMNVYKEWVGSINRWLRVFYDAESAHCNWRCNW